MAISFQTPLCRMAGIDVPIVQAPIGGLARPELAAAVSNAGALGMLSLTWADRETVAATVARTRELTDRPFGVNLILAWPQEERVGWLLDAGVPIISFHWGEPGELVQLAHAGGAIVTNTVGTVDQARGSVDEGVDIIVAQGWEAGGHVRGNVATMALVPAVCDAVGSVPVVAAGGIADGRGLAAALVLGAAGAWLGTRFVMATETRAHPRYQALVAAATDTGTVHSAVFDLGWPEAAHRTLRNSTTEAWEAAGRPATDRPGETDVLATRDGEPILRYASTSPAVEMEGDIEALSLWAGQSAGLIRDVIPAGKIVRRIAAEAIVALERASAAHLDEESLSPE
jgi:nitronate monooxygenase